ncbi:FCD domain-containing protein [Streptomyces prunicolor]|uniref:FCD domain-containing protein n=1 Tax=Streptomyces prunicolor TaxID=67348 RepID=UPI00224E6A98|nr:FCD domain-containing protein [Streptomyces prunicolor]MCX5242992.1 FCD domain-containing protein [Streptomyces prunicolor]
MPKRQTRQSCGDEREGIEPACAALAASHRTNVDLAKLDDAHTDLVAAGEDNQRSLRADIRWHNAMARAGENEPLIGFMSALSQSIHTATNIEQFRDADIRRLTAHSMSKVSAVRSVAAGGDVRIVTLNRPDRPNGVSEELRRRLPEVWRELADDTKARAVVLTGAGLVFSACGDFDRLLRHHTDPDLRERSIRCSAGTATATATY